MSIPWEKREISKILQENLQPCHMSIFFYFAWILIFTLNMEAATGGVLLEKLILKISQISQENTCVRVSFLIKLQASGQAFNFIKKETLTQVFSCEFSKIFKNTFFHRTPPMAASAISKCGLLKMIFSSVAWNKVK